MPTPTGPPDPAAAVALEASQAISSGDVTAPVSMAGIEVAEALLGQRPMTDVHVRAMATHDYEPGSINAALFGGEPGRTWAEGLLAVEARTAATRERPSLREMSESLNEINRRFRDRVEQTLAQAMRVAVRKASRKAEVRARRKTTTQLAAIRDDWMVGALTPPVLAAISTEMEELLDESFTDAADQVAILFARRQRERRAVLRQTFPDLDEAEIEEQWGPEEERRGNELRAFVVGAMFTEAAMRLSQPRDASPFAPEGEAPIDPATPGSVVIDAVRVADGAVVGPGGVEDPTPLDGTGKPPMWDYTDDLVTDLVARQAPGAVVTYLWEVGAPSRPFEPHQDLAGVTFTNDTYWTVCAKDPSEFPFGDPAYMPGDHNGCQCLLDTFYDEPEGDAE